MLLLLRRFFLLLAESKKGLLTQKNSGEKNKGPRLFSGRRIWTLLLASTLARSLQRLDIL